MSLKPILKFILELIYQEVSSREIHLLEIVGGQTVQKIFDSLRQFQYDPLTEIIFLKTEFLQYIFFNEKTNEEQLISCSF